MKNILKKLLRDNRGQVLIAIIVLMAVGGIVVVPYLYLASATVTAVEVSKKNMDGFYACDSGIEFSLWRIIQNDNPKGTFDKNTDVLLGDINGTEVSVTIAGDSGHAGDQSYYTVTVKATLTGEATAYRAYITDVRRSVSSPYQIISISPWRTS